MTIHFLQLASTCYWLHHCSIHVPSLRGKPLGRKVCCHSTPWTTCRNQSELKGFIHINGHMYYTTMRISTVHNNKLTKKQFMKEIVLENGLSLNCLDFWTPATVILELPWHIFLKAFGVQNTLYEKRKGENTKTHRKKRENHELLARICVILGSDIHAKPFPPWSSSEVLLSVRRCKRNATIHW